MNKIEETERAMGVGRRTREEIVNWNQIDGAEIVDRGETSNISGLPFGRMKTV